MLHIEFITDLGAKVSVDVENESKLLDVQRHYGRLGWTSGEIPVGGYQFPLENEPDFSWALIGARKWTNPEGEEMILHRGHAYRRRELEAVDSRKMKLPAAVKYSRGAKSTDPDHIREKSDGEIEYVTLAIFRGGKRQEKYAEPRQQQERPAAQASEDDKPTTEQLNQARQRISVALQDTEYREWPHPKYAAHILGREVSSLKALSMNELKQVVLTAEGKAA